MSGAHKTIDVVPGTVLRHFREAVAGISAFLDPVVTTAVHRCRGFIGGFADMTLTTG